MNELEVLDRWFPGAEGGWSLSMRQIDRIREAGGRPNLTVYGACLCSDELCAGATRLDDKLDGPFHLGGLAGLPHVGQTGFTALGHHVPDRGTAFILYGPHVGIDETGRLGYVRRPGQREASPCCGALMLALSRFAAARERGERYPPAADPADPQQSRLEHELAPYIELVLDDAEPVAALTELAWQLIHERVDALVRAVESEFRGDEIVLCGGVMIHLRPGEEDRFQVRHEEVRSHDSR